MSEKIIGATVGTPLNPEMLRDKIGTTFRTDDTLKLENGVLSVNTANSVDQDNSLPVTSAAVFATVGNIETLLKTI